VQGKPPLLLLLCVRRIQSQDPNDPWMQQEWGEVLARMPGRAAEAGLHFQAAGLLLAK
jgi:hypothetical protein